MVYPHLLELAKITPNRAMWVDQHRKFGTDGTSIYRLIKALNLLTLIPEVGGATKSADLNAMLLAMHRGTFVHPHRFPPPPPNFTYKDLLPVTKYIHLLTMFSLKGFSSFFWSSKMHPFRWSILRNCRGSWRCVRGSFRDKFFLAIFSRMLRNSQPFRSAISFEQPSISSIAFCTDGVFLCLLLLIFLRCLFLAATGALVR